MAYTNSPLVNHTRLSPNHSGLRNHAIDTITIHCVVGQCSVESLGSLFADPNRGASSNYGIGYDGRIGMYVEEKNRSWCSSSSYNDNRAVTIEVASDMTEPLAVRDAAYKSLIKLVADICKRNGIQKLVWSTNRNERMNHLNGCNMTVHRDYANKSCPGTWLYERHGQIAAEVNKLLDIQTQTQTSTSKTGSGTSTSSTLASGIPDIYYQVFAKGKWLPYVKNLSDYAGLSGNPIFGMRCKVSNGHIRYRVHLIGGGWLPWVTDIEDFAGSAGLKSQIDSVQMELVGLSGYTVRYRVKCVGKTAYLPYVTGWNDTNSSGYAGIYGVPIDRLQVILVKS